MSFFWGRFDPIEGTIDEEVQHLYRRRELDPNFKNKEGLLVALSTTSKKNLDNFQVANSYMTNQEPNDAKYQSMTEEERIENGIPSKYMIFNTSLYNLFGSCIWLGIGLLWYSRIYYPGGIILRRQRVEKPLSYLKKRLPIVSLFLYSFYNMLFYKLNYNIDYSSDNEDEIDNEFSKIKNLAI